MAVSVWHDPNNDYDVGQCVRISRPPVCRSNGDWLIAKRPHCSSFPFPCLVLRALNSLGWQGLRSGDELYQKGSRIFMRPMRQVRSSGLISLLAQQAKQKIVLIDKRRHHEGWHSADVMSDL